MIIKAAFPVKGDERPRTVYYPSFALYSAIDEDHAPSMTHAALPALMGMGGHAWATQWKEAEDGALFLLELRIQSSRPGHLKDDDVQAQGVDTRRIEFLRRTGIPVLFAFGMNRAATNFAQAWLHDLPDTPMVLDRDPASPRRGWAVNRPPWRNGPLVIPVAVPDPLPRAQEALI